MKKIIPLFLIILVIGVYFYFNSKKTDILGSKVDDSSADLILYWGEGCPHCEKVKNYIKENALESKIKIAYKEIYSSSENQKNLAATVISHCPEIDTSQGIGVPLAFDTQSNKCLYGDTPIIEWFEAK